VGGPDPHRQDRRGGGAPDHRRAGGRLSETPRQSLDVVVRRHWWGAVATLTRLTGDLDAAEDAVQDACVAALAQWPGDGVPANPGGWLVTVARRRAIDRLRREAQREGKEAAAVRELEGDGAESADSRGGGDGAPDWHGASDVDDELRLVFLCCHPALALEARVALTLRAVCGLTTSEIAAAFLVPEPTMAKRLVRAKSKIRDAGIAFRMPRRDDLGERLAAVLRVIYVVFTEGHMASTGPALVRGDLCDTAIGLARGLVARLPDEPEAHGLLALLLLTDARRAARTDPAGELVLLEDQDRSLWDAGLIAEGEAVLEGALRAGRPGPYQLHAAIAACHTTAPTAAATDWRQIALLYGELIRYEPSPVVEANRAVAVAMSEGPAAGLVILDAVAHHRQLQRWPRLHVARAELLRRLGRRDDAAAAFRTALELEPPAAERASIVRRLAELGADGPPHRVDDGPDDPSTGPSDWPRPVGDL
jgi:RNA polymerase sigma-70 factor (ECF subfamily)